MPTIIHIKDDFSFVITSGLKLRLDQNIAICFNNTSSPCRRCNKCNTNRVVEMSEDGSEVWVEFTEEKR